MHDVTRRSAGAAIVQSSAAPQGAAWASPQMSEGWPRSPTHECGRERALTPPRGLPRLWTSGLSNCEVVDFCGLSHPAVAG